MMHTIKLLGALAIIAAGFAVGQCARTAKAQDCQFSSGFEACGPAELLTLDASPAQIDPGQSAVVSWQIPSEATGYVCSLTDGVDLLDDATLRSGHAVTVTLSDSAVYQLDCDGPEGQVWSATAAVEVSGNSGPLGQCSPSTAPRAQLFLNRTVERWEDVVGEIGKPDTGRQIQWGRDQFVNLEFTIPADANDFFRASLKWVSTALDPGTLRLAVQECKGAPSSERAISPSCYSHQNGAGNIEIRPAGNPALTCVVQRGRPYVLAVAFVHSNGVKSCDTTQCAWFPEEE